MGMGWARVGDRDCESATAQYIYEVARFTVAVPFRRLTAQRP
jgi:hypothetical protein